MILNIPFVICKSLVEKHLNIKLPDVVQGGSRYTYIENLISQCETILFSGIYQTPKQAMQELLIWIADWYLIKVF
jgi:hypothetical protein